MSHGENGVVGGPVEKFQRTKMQELEGLLATQNQLERDVEGGFCWGLLTLNQTTTGWDLFYRLQNQIDGTRWTNR